MKNYIFILFVGFCSLIVDNSANAQNWIPYQGYTVQTIQVYNYPVSVQPVPQPVIVYQWTPYIVSQTTVAEHHCLFRRVHKVTTEPVVQWIYSPVVVYK